MNNLIYFIWNIVDTFNDFKNFLIHPDFKKTKITFAKILAVIFIILVQFIFESNYLESLYSLFPNLENSYSVNNTVINDFSIQLVLLYLILSPLIEELCFRGWMTKNKNLSLLLIAGTTTLILSYFVLPFIIAFFEFELSEAVFTSIQYIILSICFISSYILIGNRIHNFSNFVLRHAGTLFYLSCFLFAIVHIANYEEGVSGRVMLLAQLPIFTSAIILGYLRIRFGLLYSFSYHFVSNLLALAYVLLSQES